ncbi:tumor necrosis factor receptor superfamily member 10B-like [Vidua chalybeata]|uniref:tumor necrosis factor receptor superfamily member 10B-like n=1 Tax=Vidua chalybeata TaxID=81927 RepID=UPI0023A8CE46|nr:tumor necrosis factor receptor superfamily member 10B-like [Vidua chalybeata]
MRRPRQRCLPVLLLVTASAFGASAVTFRRRDLTWRGEDGYYRKSDGVYCQKCPAGTYIAEECKEQNGSGRCEPCRPGEYMEYPNAFQWCQDCSECREDQVKQSPCQPLRNTVCVCKNGTFCPPEHPCEMCQKCQPRCPEGQVELKHCTPNSDLLCGPGADTWPSYIKAISIITVIGVILVVFCCWKRLCSSPGDGRPSSRRPYKIVSSMFRKLLSCKEVSSEDNTPVERRQPHTPAEIQEMLPNEKPMNEKPMRRLVPAPGQEPSDALRSTFYIFAGKIPMDYWMKFGHSLNLEDNDINMAKSDDGFYNMMRKWQNREGSKASVNTLLETLVRLNLGGVAEDMSSRLLKNGFQYEIS